MSAGQRICMGLYEATIPPGGNVRVSHCVRDTCRLDALWIDRGNAFEGVRLWVDPHRAIALGEPHREAEKIWRWPVLGNWIVPGEGLASIYLDARNLTNELIALRAVVWAELV